MACVPDESCLPHTARDEGFVVRSDDGEGFVVRSDDGQHRICRVCGEAAALPNALGGALPHTPFSGRSPAPTLNPQFSVGTKELR